MASRQNTNPWGDATNQAVGALFKAYMSRPSQTDQIKMQLENAQLQNLQRGQQLGDYTLENLSPEIRNQMFYDHAVKSGDSEAAQRFRDIMFHPTQVDLGDRKAMMGMGGIVPGTENSVGVAPKTEFDKENNQLINIPAIPSQPINPTSSPLANLFGAVIQQESGGDPAAMSPAGAAGIAQIMPATARDPGYGVAPLSNWDGVDPRTAPVDEQMRFGKDYLGAMVNHNGGSVEKGLAAYNAGPGAVDQHGGVPPYPETQHYVQKVMADAGAAPGGASVTPLPKTADASLKEHDKNLSVSQDTGDLNNTFSSALSNIEKGGAGLGSYAKDVPFVGGQTSAAYLQADLGKITSKAALDKIAQLKEESKTGGFFGNLSDGERQAVADSQLAIRQSMDPQELAYRLLMHKDKVNDIINGRGQVIPGTNQVVPMDAGQPRSGLPTMTDIENAQSPDDLMKMWDAFDKFPVFKGRPPQMIDDALAHKMNQLRGVQ